MIAAFVLAGTYAVIALGRVPVLRVDRTGAAIIGAILMVVVGGLPFDEAVAGIDARTIVLLYGMMVLVAHLRMAGFFGLLAQSVATRIASPSALLVAVVFAAGILSALFVNDTICLVFAPIVMEAARVTRRSPVPLLLGVATGSNIGSVATLLVKTLLVAAAMFAAFIAGYDSALVAAAGAAALLVTRRVKPERVYRQVDWDLLVLFVGLFVVVAGARHAGLSDRLFTALSPLGIHTVPGLSLVTALLSNLISNVPAVMLFTHMMPAFPDPRTGWLTLAMSSTLAGNLTLVGSIANLIVVQSARKEGVVLTFWDYLKVGVPVTGATIGVGIWWLR